MGSGASRGAVMSSGQRQSHHTQSQLMPTSMPYGYTAAHSAPYTPNPQPPPAGFIVQHLQSGAHMSTVPGGEPMDTSAWDEKRDLAFTRILSAEEFLARMDETDESVRLYSQTEERQTHLPKITELLGLRGHLQDELLRIEKMLAEDDPTLTSLAEFEMSHSRAVHRLREINQKAKVIHAVPIPIKVLDIVETDPDNCDNHPSSVTDDSTQNTKNPDTVSKETQSSNVGRQLDSKGHGDVGVQVTHAGDSHSINVQCDDEVTDEVLKEKHNEEEVLVAKNYAKRIVENQGRLSGEEMDRLLQDHLTSMQALRNRQQQERDKLLSGLENKKQMRLLQRRAAEQNYGDIDDDHDVKAWQRPDWQNIYSRFDSPSRKNGHVKNASKPVISIEIDTSPRGSSANSPRNTTQTSMSGSTIHLKQGCLDDVDLSDDGQKTTSVTSSHTSLPRDNTHSPAVRSLTPDRGSHCASRSSDEGRASISPSPHLSDDQSDQLLDEYNDEDLHKIHSSPGVDAEELELRDDEFVNKVSHLRRSNRGSEDVNFGEMVNAHLREVQDFIFQRNARNEALHNKMMAKLRSKNESTLSDEEDDQKVKATEDELTELEHSISHRLVHNHSMSDDDIRQILTEYRKQQLSLLEQRNQCRQKLDHKLNQKLKKKKGKTKTNIKKRAEVDKEVVTSLVTEHQANTREIQNIRRREMDKVDLSLRDKLIAKRNRTKHSARDDE